VTDAVLRPPRLDDVPAVTITVNAWSRAQRGRASVTEQALRGWWTQPPPFDLEQDVVIACEGAICRQEYGDPGCGWISTLGVLPDRRGWGIGTALLTDAPAAFKARSLPRGGLDVDVENESGALRLYERAGMHAVERQETWELRP
jgi:GNAT superfamily N-acetyltransferase